MSNLYAQIATSLPGHPKLRRLSRLLQIERAHAGGLLAFLWARSLEYAADGDLSGWDPEDVAEHTFWHREPEELVRALVACGFLVATESGLRVHDWREHTGNVLWKRRIAREKKRKQRLTPEKQTKEGDSPGHVSPSCPPTTRHDTTRLDSTRHDSGGVGGVEKPTAKPKPKRKSKPKQPDLPELLAEHADEWRRKFPALDGRGGRPSITDEAHSAWDHSARKKRSDMRRYVETWLRRSNADWANRTRFQREESPVALGEQPLSPEELAARHAERVRRHQQAKGGGDG